MARTKLFWLPVSAFLASTTLLAGVARSECCYAVSFAPLSTAPSSFSLTLTSSSQAIVDSAGMVYQTDVSFPSGYVISPLPSSCTLRTETDLECNSSGSPLFSVVFPSITPSDPNTQPLLSYVGIDGEACTQQPTCPRLSPSNGNTSTGSNGPSATSSTPPPSATRNPTNNNNSNLGSSSVDGKKAAIIGVAVSVVIIILIALCIVLRRNTTSVSSTGLTRKNSMHQRMARRSGDGVPAGGPGSFGGPDGYALYRQRTLNRARSVRDLQEKAAAAAAAAAAMRSRDGLGSGIGGSTAGLTSSFGSASELSMHSHPGMAGDLDSRAEMGLARHPSTRTYTSLRTMRSMAGEHESAAHVNVFEDSQYMTDDRILQKEKVDDIQLEPTSPIEPRSGPPVISSPLARKPSSRKPTTTMQHAQHSTPPERALKHQPSEPAISKSVGFVDMDRDEMKADRTAAPPPTELHRSVSLTRPPPRSPPPLLHKGMGGLSSTSLTSTAEEAAQTVEATRGLQRSLSTKERRELDQHRAHASRHIMRSDSDD